mmetsp:Transcript_540/g.1275  ORF Transcript_540/g.1275 Transcript_540/m.1275 type:complete len:156 (-) Transcript_540:54-521(-)
MTRSFRRLESVVRSAYNNVIGAPGKYFFDHIFAFSDTGFHIFHLVVSIHLLGAVTSALICCGIAAALAAAMGMYCHYTKGDGTDTCKARNGNAKKTLDRAGDLPICHCTACRCPAKRKSAFCIRLERSRISVCSLWMSSFRQVLSEINLCNGKAD